MAGRVPSFNYPQLAVTTPKGTAKATPQSVTWAAQGGTLVSLELEVPPGPRGFLGVSITANGVSYIPWGNSPQYLVVDDYTKEFDMHFEWNYPLQVVTYNLDVFDHTIWLRAKLLVDPGTDVGAPVAAPMVAL